MSMQANSWLHYGDGNKLVGEWNTDVIDVFFLMHTAFILKVIWSLTKTKNLPLVV